MSQNLNIILKGLTIKSLTPSPLERACPDPSGGLGVRSKIKIMQKKFIAVLITLLALFNLTLMAQDNKTPAVKTYKVGIFAALYLDSVFTDNNYRYSRNFPRFILQGLDFVQGAQIALDSFPIYNGNIVASMYDSKSISENIDSLIRNKKLDSLDLIIGSVKDDEYLKLANFALQKNIPFISATYPNDAGVTGNPFLVIVNSTLKAHCEAIYSYLLQNHGTDRIFLCRKPGTQEDKVARYFKMANEQDGKPLLDIRTINFNDSNFTALKNNLDSNSKNIIIGGSLDEAFAFNLANEAYAIKNTYPLTLIGMPNWDAFKSFTKNNTLVDFPIIFTSTFYNSKWDNYTKMIQNIYLKKYKGIPSDYTFKGFETVFLFSRLLMKYPDDFMSHLNDDSYKVFSDYNFKPVLNNKTPQPDYFENKHLYFLKTENGKITKAW